MRRGPLRDNLDDDLSTIAISPFVTYIASRPWSDLFVWLRCAAEQVILFDASLFEVLTRTHYFDYGIIIPLRMTMRENQ